MQQGLSKKNKPLQFEVIDLPSGGVTIEEELSFEEAGLPDEPRCQYLPPLRCRLHFEAINGENDLLVRGSVRGQARLVCDRCEEWFTREIAVDGFCQVFEKAFGKTIDLTDFIREDILISFPQQILCRPDCRGLCPHCGQNLNEGQCDCRDEDFEPDESGDNPWSALDAIPDDRRG